MKSSFVTLPPKLQTTKGLGYASTMHSRVRGLPGALPSTDSPGRMLGETELKRVSTFPDYFTHIARGGISAC